MKNRSDRAVTFWLGSLCTLVIAMVAVGGITRLTNSGLSIVDWQPVLGVLPPLTRDDWLRAFARYRSYPQYRIQFPGMTLAQFQGIYFWEYAHRLLGRAIGLALALPLAWFVWKGRITRKLGLRLGIAFVLGGLQGLLGWFMVKSGLVDVPHVSHYRLAAHLALALVLLCYLLWVYLDVRFPRVAPAASPLMRLAASGFLALVFLQIIYGAFVAGLKAGFAFNTWPLMAGEFIPPGFWALSPGWLNLFDNPASVQFIHRCLAYAIALAVVAFCALGRAKLAQPQRRALIGVSGAVGLQVALGITTLLLVVPVPVASLHQIGATLVLSASVWFRHSLSKP